MYRFWAIIVIFLLGIADVMAQRLSPFERLKTGDEALDSLLIQINRNIFAREEKGIARLEMYAEVNGHSYNTKLGPWASILYELYPFDGRKGKETYFDAFCQISYQDPCELLIAPLSLRTNNRRRGRKALSEAASVLLPTYAITHMKDRGSNKSYTMPFTNSGLLTYHYTTGDTLQIGNRQFLTIHFSPKKPHHTLVEGKALFDLQQLMPEKMWFSGRTDFGVLHDTLVFGIQNGHPTLSESHVGIDYKYAKSEGHNHFDCRYICRQMLMSDEFDDHNSQLDLSDIYTPEETQYLYTDTAHNSYADQFSTNERRSHTLFKKLPQRLVGSSDVNAFGTDLRIYGPLNPATLGYDKRNGITLRERLRFSHLWDNGKSLLFRPEVGIAFRNKEFRYRADVQYIYAPQKRAGLRLQARNYTNGFSSKFKDAVNNRMSEYKDQLKFDWKAWRNGIDFDDLGLTYVKRHEFKLEHSYEVSNGLMMYLGATYNYRKPVIENSHLKNEEDANLLIDKFYADMNPYVRLVYTPCQYYHHVGPQKLYLDSRWPTFTFEYSQGIYGFCGSESNYSKIEFDAQQTIRLGSVRSLSWHLGSGGFFRQEGEYFINYDYFSRSQYPSTWEKNELGGVFTLLDDYWYNSSPGYIQTHLMYESPFLLLHQLRPIAKYVIHERIYASHLWASGKNAYTEIGYGMGNNYFNVGLFTGFVGLQFMDIGLKFSIEIDQHL